MSIVKEIFGMSRLIRTFYNNIKNYDFMIKVRDKKKSKI